MKATKYVICAAFALVVTAAVAYGFWGPAKQGRRALTPGEMARLHGRQPAPNPCPSCYLKDVAVKCSEKDPCGCAYGTAKCSATSQKSLNVKTVTWYRDREEEEELNEKEPQQVAVPCFFLHDCIVDSIVPTKECNPMTGICLELTASLDCTQCKRGPFVQIVTVVGWECIDCK